ncbi:MAG: histidine phosphatase family protein [Polyangiaceae bacterium]
MLLVARHGETDWNKVGRLQGHTDTPLNERGRAQALELAGRLADEDLAWIVTSDLARAVETADIVARALGVKAEIARDARLREQGFGELEGLHREEIVTRYARDFGYGKFDYRVTPPGGETWPELVARVEAATREVFDRLELAQEGAPLPPKKTGLIVAHGGVLRALLSRFGVSGSEPRIVANCELLRFVREGDTIREVR